MEKNDILTLFKCLSEKSRLDILISLQQSSMYVEQLAERLGLTPSTVSFHLKKMEKAKLVTAKKEQYYTIYTLNDRLLHQSIDDLLSGVEKQDNTLEEREKQYRERVIQTFFQQGKLVSIPVQRKKRLIILEEMVNMFEPGKTYSEREINIMIADYNDDFCTIRREFIMEGLMERKDGVYKRRESADAR